jgi:hypothetical protein
MSSAKEVERVFTTNRVNYTKAITAHAAKVLQEISDSCAFPTEAVNNLEQETRAILSGMMRELGYPYGFDEIRRVGVFLGNGHSYIRFAAHQGMEPSVEFELTLRQPLKPTPVPAK